MRYYSSGQKMEMRREIAREQEQLRQSHNNKLEQIKEQEDMRALEIYSSRGNRQRREIKLAEAKSAVKSILLSECLDLVFENSLESSQPEKIRKHFINKFIKEAGVDELLSEYKSKTIFLSEMTRVINKHFEQIMENAQYDENGEIVLDVNTQINKMLDELDKDEIGVCIDAIKTRVANSYTEFIRNNAIDKAKVEAIIDKAQEDINKTTNESMIEEYNRQTKIAINNVKTRRSKTIFESMVNAMTKAVVKDEALNESFISNKQECMSTIIENAKTMYTFLEMVNTLSLRKVDIEYIEEVMSQLEA